MSDRILIQCLCGRRHELDASPQPANGPRMLIALADGFGPISGATLSSWAKSGRLRAYRAERGRLVSWSSDIERAIEADAVGVVTPTKAPLDDPFEGLERVG